MRVPLPQRTWVRLALLVPPVCGVMALLWWRGPEIGSVVDAFEAVAWRWIVVAILLNLLSVVARVLAWDTVIHQAMPEPRPALPAVFSAFSIGLFANAVLPGRIGELARVAVLTRKLPERERYEGAAWATLLGTVFAHRVFDLVPVLMLVAYVLVTAKIPEWAITSLAIAAVVGVGLFAFALASARHHERGPASASAIGLGPARKLLLMARYGLGVMHAPLAAAVAIFFQCVGWLCQLFAVYTTMIAFQIDAPMPAAALVLLLMNVATIFPLWPGNVGLVQAAVAIPLISYGVASAHGIAFGFGLQAVEACVGVGLGLIFLAREGLSYAMLKVMPDASQADVPGEEGAAVEEEKPHRARARVPG
jgi:glycosyltransferase 2 family protein